MTIPLRVSFEPQAIRDHFEGCDPDPTKELTDAQLSQVGEYALSAENLWTTFHEILLDAINDAPWEIGERTEYSEHLWITTGINGNTQESSFMNATLQRVDQLEFSVAVHVDVPFQESASEAKLREYLREVFEVAIKQTDLRYGTGTLTVEIQLGPADGG